MRFEGSTADFKEFVSRTGVAGEWSEKDGMVQLRCKDGAILNFFPTTGTVQFQGKPEARERLAAVLDSAQEGVLTPSARPTQLERKEYIFVVHGHDNEARDDLELALRRLGLEPFILMNAGAGGQTIIEALEGHIGRDYSSSFGIVLMTPDDMGYAKVDGADKTEPRARQNVILEAGMLLASLTRKRMVLLKKGHLEMPSDLNGLIYLGFNDHVKEVLPNLVNQLREAGIRIDDKRLAEAMA